MPRELNFAEHNINEVYSEIKDMFWQDLEDGSRRLLKWVYEKGLQADFDGYINAGRHERVDKRRGSRNGYRGRTLLTKSGVLALRVPRDREGRYKPKLFERYKRVDRVVDDGIRAMYLCGVSTRKVGDILNALCGERVSASYVSTATKELDHAVRQYANSPVDDNFRFVFLDGLSVKIRVGLKARRFMILVAYGIRSDGSRRLIGFRKVKSESYGCWSAFLDNLKVRGLKGRNLELIIMDGSKGLWSAVEELYPLARHQLCWVHKLRNVSKYCLKKYREECMSGATRIMTASSAGLAAKQFRVWKREWREKIPRAVKCLENDFDRLIPVFEFPREIRKMIRTTNVIERCFREVRRRLKVMGYFQNSQSCNRIVYALFNYFNSKWKRNRGKIKPIMNLYKIAA